MNNDPKTLSIKIINDINKRHININTFMDIIVLIMEIVEPMFPTGDEKLNYTLSVIDCIIKDGKGIVPENIIDALEYLYNNKCIVHIIEIICTAFKQKIALLSKTKCCISFKNFICFNKHKQDPLCASKV